MLLVYFHNRKFFKYHLANNSNINENGELLLINTIKKFKKNLDLIIDVGANIGDRQSTHCTFWRSPINIIVGWAS